jgi:hypothetical protein
MSKFRKFLGILPFLIFSSVVHAEDKPQPRLLMTGTVDKIDAKKKTFTLSNAATFDLERLERLSGGQQESARPARSGKASGQRGGSNGSSRGNREGAEGNGGTAAGRSDEASHRSSSTPMPNIGILPPSDPTKHYVVEISNTTEFKEGENTFNWADLKPGDTVQIITLKGGSKVRALEITRLPKNAPPQG